VPARLAEVYRAGDAVEVYFTDAEEWRPGVVVAVQPPAVWVRMEEGTLWFVTNGRRIRQEGPPENHTPSGMPTEHNVG
jgi:hypothetical protein